MPGAPTHHVQLVGEGHELGWRRRIKVHPSWAPDISTGQCRVVWAVGAPGLLADLDIEEVFALAHFGAGLAVTRVLGETKPQQPVRVAVELLEVGGFAQLVLRGPAVFAVEAVTGDEAADTAHGDNDAVTKMWGLEVAVTVRGRPDFARRLRS